MMKGYMKEKIKLLLEGKRVTIKPKGNSMVPLIKSKQTVLVEPVTLHECEVSDVVLCKVKGKIYLHLIAAKDKKRGVQICNSKGRINGWTKKVYGKVSVVFE